MKVAVVTHSPVPFRSGGAERLAAGLTGALVAAGHETEQVKLPVREYALADLVAAYEQYATLDLSHFDLVVSGRYPAWMVDHPHHVVWMLHPLRGLYDTYPASHFVDERLPDTPTVTALLPLLDADPEEVDPFELIEATLAHAATVAPDDASLAVPGPLARAVVHQLDRHALSPRRIRRHAAISATVAGRPGYFPPGVAPRVLHPPPHVPAPPGGPDAPPSEGPATFVTASRLEQVKRIDLVIEAFRALPGDVRLVIAGEGPDRDRLAGLAAGDPRIEMVGRVPDDQLAATYRTARAVVFCPRDEDYGYVAVEAMAQGRGVITTTDAGGPTELVGDGFEGRVTEPTPVALAAAMAEAADRPDAAAAWGAAAAARAATLRWSDVVAGLTDPPRRRLAGPLTGRRARLVGVSSYPLAGGRGGGPLRAHHLFAAVAAAAELDVEVISVTPGAASTERHALGPHVRETVVPLSARHVDAETELRLLAGPVSITDVAVGLMWRATPSLVRELGAVLDSARLAWFVQPYLAPAVAELAPGLDAVYDAHNHERSLKEAIYPPNEAGGWLAARVAEIEHTAARAAGIVTATTDGDLAALVDDWGLEWARTLVVPNGVDTDAVAFTGGEDRRRRRRELVDRLGIEPTSTVAVFVGSGHGPNIEAGRDLIEVAPSLGDVELLLVGRHTASLAGTRRPPNVHLLGPLDDDGLASVLAGADVALNPVRHGGGSNLKVLTYLAAGLPVVSSRVGARGVDVAGAGVVLAEVGGLGDALALATDAGADERAAAGRRWVEEHADWRIIGAPIGAMIGEVVRS